MTLRKRDYIKESIKVGQEGSSSLNMKSLDYLRMKYLREILMGLANKLPGFFVKRGEAATSSFYSRSSRIGGVGKSPNGSMFEWEIRLMMDHQSGDIACSANVSIVGEEHRVKMVVSSGEDPTGTCELLMSWLLQKVGMKK